MPTSARRQSTPRATGARRSSTPKASAPKPKEGKLKVVSQEPVATLPGMLDGPKDILAERMVGMPSAVAKAVELAREKVGKLIKTKQNDYAQYTYVPIDQFYEDAVPIIASCGISLDAQEDALIVSGDFLIYKFIGVLTYAKDGSRYALGSIHIPHRMDGPQTAGSAHSYADKVLMRRFLKIATGEPDGDSQRPANYRGRAKRALDHEDRRAAQMQEDYERDVARYADPEPTPAPAPKPEKVWPAIPETPYNTEYDFTDYVRSGKTVEELNELYRRAKDRISSFGAHDQTWIIDLFARRKEGVGGNRDG